MKILENTLERNIRSEALKRAFVLLKQDLFALVDNSMNRWEITEITLKIRHSSEIDKGIIQLTETNQTVYRPIEIYPHDLLISQYLTFEQVKKYLQALTDRRLEAR